MGNTIIRDDFFKKLVSGDQILQLFDLLPDVSFFLKDRECRFIGLNRRGCEYCGVAREEEAFGKTDHDFFPTERADSYRADDLAVMKNGEPIINRIEAAPEQAGSNRMVITDKIPMHDRKGLVIGLAGFSRQIERLSENSGTVDQFAQMIDHMRKNFGEPMTTKQLAKMSGMSGSQFDRRFRQAFGSSPHQYLLRLRVNAAARALLETHETIATIALDCGFYDHAHLCRSFRKIMKATPSGFRSRNKGNK
jgi:AraC-like DNA-binding protein